MFSRFYLKICKNKNSFLLNGVVLLILLIVPYLVFQGRLFIGGDDSRLFYSYSLLWMKNIAFYSWFSFSSLPTNNANQFILPLLVILSIGQSIIHSAVFWDYISFSLPLMVGFIYIQKLIRLLLDDLDNRYIFPAFFGSLVYILSPILAINQLATFLYSVWLIGLVPALGFYYVLFLKKGKFTSIFISMFISFFFSLAFFSIPWLFGVLLPFAVACIILGFLFTRSEITQFLKRTTLFALFIFLSQFFWLLPFVSELFEKNAYLQSVLSKGVADTFIPTIAATATGSVLYPMLQLFHRQIAFDFSWYLKDIYTSYLDKIIPINLIFIGIILSGLSLLRDNHFIKNKSSFFVLSIAFIVSLYLFTLNIGPLKYIFYLAAYIPGAGMFRNFYDKFAFGYAFCSAVTLGLCMAVLQDKLKNRKYIVYIFLGIVLIINTIPLVQLINKPLWTTKNISTNTNFTPEFEDTMEKLSNTVQPSSTMLSVPFNIAGYLVAPGRTYTDAYVGRSPIKLFTDINDYSGLLSFPPDISSELVDDMVNKKYSQLEYMLYSLNINYILNVKNIPKQIADSYIYNSMLRKINYSELISYISNKQIIESKRGTYNVYTLKTVSSILTATNSILYYAQRSSIEYHFLVHIPKQGATLLFKQPYSQGWKLYVQKNPSTRWCKNQILQKDTYVPGSIFLCQDGNTRFSGNELTYLFKRIPFESQHTSSNGYDNKWNLSQSAIGALPKDYYKLNSDGTYDIEGVLYFYPQLYFYLGTIITIITFIGCSIYVLSKLRKSK